VTPLAIDALIERSAAPAFVRSSIEQLQQHPEATRWLDDVAVVEAYCAVAGASRQLVGRISARPELLGVLAELGQRVELGQLDPDFGGRELIGWYEAEYLRVAARDLLGLDPLPATVAAISALARDVVATACALVVPRDPFAVIGMGKFGGDELNYASDIDVLFVGDGDPMGLRRAAIRVLELVRPCFRVDANLRPQGRDGPLVRTLDSYRAYWDRWAEPWEFQALLKAHHVAGDDALGTAFDDAASTTLWSRVFSADDLRSLRNLKARTEAALARQGLSEREVKRGRGGIRDIEFSVQLLQLVHGRLDPALRARSTLAALAEMANSGYVSTDDAEQLTNAYTFLRAVEHRLQLYDGTQVYAVAAADPERRRLARTLGFRDGAKIDLEQFDVTLARFQNAVRSIHERLYFRPLLEAFADSDSDSLARPGAIEARLTAFGFSEGLRTRAAVRELTRGLTRRSRLMQQMLPLLLGWLSESPDPDLGLLSLRNLLDDPAREEQLTRVFRDSPEAARRLCLLVGTSRLVADILQRNIDLVVRLPDSERLRTKEGPALVESARSTVSWRDRADRQAALLRWKERNLLGVIARDILGESDVQQVEADVTAIADTAVTVALESMAPRVPFAVIALGRYGGAELSYASDLDVVFVYDGSTAGHQAEADRVASNLRRFLQGTTPATRLWEVDTDLRPEGKDGLLARSLDGYVAYWEKWAAVWERQAMLRSRLAAGDAAVGARFMELVDDFVGSKPISTDDVREIRRIKARVETERIPARDDPQFHLKLGRGSLADIEWTVQLLQLQHRVRSASTMNAIAALVRAAVLSSDDATILADAYRFCEGTRNRLFLVRSEAGDALPQETETLTWLARSLDTTPTELRQTYRRVTRRARAVVERVFYARAPS
jgi:glutamate-ammonia-ligase adenylyltransferase